MADCFVCDKHRDLASLPGGTILADEHCLVTHRPLVIPGEVSDSVYLGHLMVEPRRHVAELGELNPDEAASFGRLASAASGALLRGLDAEHVYAAIIGHGKEHLHLHLLPRYPGTPREYWWTRVDEWPDAPRGDAAEVAALAQRLRAATHRDQDMG